MTTMKHPERGAALLTAVMVLVLIAVLAVTFLNTITGERALSSNVHVAKRSLYAADAGVRSAQQVLANMSRARFDSLAAIHPGSGPMISQPQNFFPAGATVTTSSNPQFTATTTIAFADSDLTPEAQVYNFRYRIVATGQEGGYGERAVDSEGILRVSAGRGSFADFLIYTNTHLMANGSNIWFTSSGLFDGRVHTNTEFRMAYQPTFQDLITSVDDKAWYFNQGNNVELDADNNGTVDVPNLFGGFDRDRPPVNLPPNSYNQQNAALGLSPTSGTQPSNATIRDQLGLSSGGSPPPNGIYLPNNGASLVGGIYVHGNLDGCVASVDGSGRQVYTMIQGSLTRIITVDRAANKTYFSDGTTTTPYDGVPRGILYTKGNMSGVGGPGRQDGEPQPAIADGTELLITATGDIVLQNDMIYNDFAGGQSILGLYSDDGSVRIGSNAPHDMLLDAFVMAAGNLGTFQVDGYNSGDPRGTFHLRGGMVADRYGAFYTFDKYGVLKTGYARDFHYDRRGLIPPYYPMTSIFVPNEPAARTLVWKEL